MADLAKLIQDVHDAKKALRLYVPHEELQQAYDDAVAALLSEITKDDEPVASPVIDATHDELPDYSAYNGAAE